MRMFRGPASGERSNAINLAVQVSAYVEDKGVVGVKGKRLDTGEEVVVTLSTRGDLANKPKRPSLTDFRDKKNNLGVEVGGVIGFDRCYPNGAEGKFYAGWPLFFAGSGKPEDMQRVKVNRPTTLQIRGSDASRLYGTLSVWQEVNILECKTLEDLDAATAKWLNDVPTAIPNSHGAAVMRARNAKGEVVAYTYLYSRWDKERGKYEAGQTTLTNFKESRAYEGFTEEAKANGGVTFDIVPAVNLDISPKALEDGGNALRLTEKSFQRERDLIAKGTTFVMDPNRKFVVKVMVHDPFGDSGIDPVLLGKEGKHLTYNQAFSASLNGDTPPPASDDARHQEPAHSSPAIQM